MATKKAKSPTKYALTEEHRALLAPHRDEWIANAMSTRAIDDAERETCRVAVRGLYQAAGLTPPPDHRIVFVPSPLVARLAGGFAAWIWHTRKTGSRAATYDATTAATYAATTAATTAATAAATYAATTAATTAATYDATDAATYDATTAATYAATTAATTAATAAATYAATTAATAAATYAATAAATYAATDAATDAATAAATYAATYAATRAATRAATDAATAAATYAATDAATYDATTAATYDATTAATYDATTAATYDATTAATDAATYAATDAATAAATYAATDAATYAATDAATAAATYAATDAATYDATTAATYDATTAATYDATTAATYDATTAATDAATYAATYDATDAATDAATYAATYDATDAATTAATYDATDAATYDATTAATYAATTAATRDATRAATDAATAAATDAATDLSRWYTCEDLAEIARGVLGAEWRAGLRCAQLAYQMWQGGNQWSAWASFLAFFRHVAELPIDYSKWAHYETLARHSGPRVMHEEFCIVSDRPELLTVDERNRPHGETGPFCRWRDGFALYSWHGSRVPAWAIEHPERLTVETVMAERNVETRRALIGMLGSDGLLGLARQRGRVVDADTVSVRVPAFDVGEERALAAWIEEHGIEAWLLNPPSVEIRQERTLYEIERDDDVALKLIVVHCPSSALAGEPRTYPLRARWDARTCAEAVAGSFGLTAAEYHPVAES